MPVSVDVEVSCPDLFFDVPGLGLLTNSASGSANLFQLFILRALPLTFIATVGAITIVQETIVGLFANTEEDVLKDCDYSILDDDGSEIDCGCFVCPEGSPSPFNYDCGIEGGPVNLNCVDDI